jgi:predicted nucleic acid-binding protein
VGALIWPSSGLVYLDTTVVIDSVETQPLYWPLLKPLWDQARAGHLCLITSELALMETLVGPLRSGDALLTSAYEQLFRSPEMRLIPISQPVLREAARLRALTPGLRTPDALHAATALLERCALFLTNDTGFRRVTGLPLAVLKDALTP